MFKYSAGTLEERTTIKYEKAGITLLILFMKVTFNQIVGFMDQLQISNLNATVKVSLKVKML